VEIKLFIREPITMVFTFALPLLFLFVMGEVFGNTPDPDGIVYGGVGPMNYYTPAYIGLVMASIGMVALPAHLAAYRERGVLRRLRASSLLTWRVFGSQVIVGFAIAVICAILLTIVARFAYGIDLPKMPVLTVAAFVTSLLSFAALGVLLGALLPTTRAAQGVGLVLFFVMLILGGARPPREVMTGIMRPIGEAMPLWHVISLLQGPWLGFGWNWTEFIIVAGIMVISALLSLRFFRWE